MHPAHTADALPLLCAQLGDYTQAISDYSRAIELEPNNSFAFYNRGITRERRGDLAGAVADFSVAIQLDPSSADNYHNRGYAYRRAVSAKLGV